MPGAVRLGDKAQVSGDAHGCVACPHPAIGPAISGSPDVNVNKMPAIRLDDPGVHAACCGPNSWTVMQGSTTVYFNGKPAARMGDKTRHCGNIGQFIEGSSNVIVGGPAGTGSMSGSGGGGGGGGGSYAGSAQQQPSSQQSARGGQGSGRAGQGGAGSSSGGGGEGGGEQTEGSTEDKKKEENEHVYVINTQLAAPGGVPLGGEEVVLLKAGTDEKIAGPFTTDAQGGFATLVPENVPYDVQIVDTGHSGGARTTDDGEVQAHLHVGIFENGVPLGSEPVTIIRPDGSSFGVTLDADGMLDLVADHGEHQISIRGETFHVHTLTGADLKDGGSHYELAVPPPQHDFETARAHRYHPDADDEGAE